MLRTTSPKALNLPSSSKTVKVQIIDTTTTIRCKTELFLSPHLPPHDTLTCNAYAFVIDNPRTGQKVLFDLGVRPDWENLAKPMVERLQKSFEISAEKGVSQILEGQGISLDKIESIIWSHWHFDHIGDPSTFPSTTSLVIGPGTSAAKLPPWPENPESTLTESDIRGRKVQEISQSQFSVPIGPFFGFDFFGDGSFYLLDVPGHAIGHMCGLARTTNDSFILMGADTCHHGGEYRPSKYLPMPEEIPRNVFGMGGCPCSVFEQIHPNPKEYRTERFYSIKVNEDGTSVANDVEKAEESIRGLQEFDAADEVLVVCAHDTSLVDVVDIFPKYANDWKDANWKMEGRWRFLGDWKQ